MYSPSWCEGVFVDEKNLTAPTPEEAISNM
jgi:hypothetical protein